MTQDKCIVLDKIFLHLYKNKKYSITRYDISELFNISVEQANFFVNYICEFNDQHVKLLTYEKFDDGESHIVCFDTYLSDEFISSGGFLWYFDLIRKKAAKEKRKTWPSRNWLFVAIITYILGCITPTIQEWIKLKLLPNPTHSTTQK